MVKLAATAALVSGLLLGGLQLRGPSQGGAPPRIDVNVFDYPGDRSGYDLPTDGNAITIIEGEDFNGTTLTPTLQTGGDSWAKVGSPTSAEDAFLFPSGFSGTGKKAISSLSDANHFTLGSGSDALDIVTGNFFGCMAYKANTAGDTCGLGNRISNTSGWIIQPLRSSGQYTVMNIYKSGGVTTVSETDSTAALTGVPNIFCFGRSGATGYLKSNLGTLRSAAISDSAEATTSIAHLGRCANAGLAFDGSIYSFYVSSTAFTEALADAATGRFFGHYADTGQTLTLTRATQASYVLGSTRYTQHKGVVRHTSLGTLLEPQRSNYFQTSTSPADQTITLGTTGSYYAWIEGSGSQDIAVGTATATGLPCTATAASPCAFTITGAGTITTTKTGTVTATQVENGTYATALIVTAAATGTRNADVYSVPASGVLGWTAQEGSVTLHPEFSNATAGTDRPILKARGLHLRFTASDAKFRFSVGGATAVSAAQTFAVNDAITVAWRYILGSTVCITINSETEACAASAPAFINPDTLYIGGDGTDAFGGYLSDVTIDRTTNTVLYTAPPSGTLDYAFDANDIDGAGNTTISNETEYLTWENAGRLAATSDAVAGAESQKPVAKANASGTNWALSFDGIQDNMSWQSSNDWGQYITATGVFTLAFTFRTSNTTKRCPVGGMNGTTSNGIAVYIDTDDTLHVVLGNGTTTIVSATSTFTAPPNVWTTLMVRGDGTNIYLSKNGGAEEQTAFTGSLVSPTAAMSAGLLFGRDSSSNNPAGGDIGAGYLYSTSLSSDDRTQLVNYMRQRWQ